MRVLSSLRCMTGFVAMVLAQNAVAAVLILEGAAPQPANPGPAMTTPSPAQREPVPANQEILRPAAAPVDAAPPSTEAVGPPPASPSDLSTVKLTNPAEIAIDMLPGQTVSIGSRVSFRITSKRPGYLVLIDIDANGHLSQIYPTTASLVQTSKPNGNFMKAGTLTIPLATGQNGPVEYVVTPPKGNAMVVAVLSAQPVQLLDLPDAPPGARSQSDVLAYLVERTSELRIPDDATSRLRENRWSFNAKPYSIQ